VLAEGMDLFYNHGDARELDAYSQTVLRRIWKAERFSWWMTSILHRNEHDDAFGRRMQHAELDYVFSSEAAARSLAENYVGLPLRV